MHVDEPIGPRVINLAVTACLTKGAVDSDLAALANGLKSQLN